MAYKISGPQFLGVAALGSTYTSLPDSTYAGQVVEAKDDATGYWGKFKLLLGCANTVVGSVVSYNGATGTTALAPTTGNSNQPLAVAMSANTSTTAYGWYQVEGVATVKKTAVAVAPSVILYLSATAGRVKVIQSAGLQILGARSANAATVTSTTSTVLVTLAPGFQAQGQVT
jgi:hypothetical protein